MRSISFITIPDFQIAAERALNHKLNGRPLAVAAGGGSRAPLIEVSGEARSRGVRRGMTANDGRRSCRDLTFLPPNQDVCNRAKEAMARIIEQFTPVSEPARQGQFFLDLTGTDRLFGGALRVTELLQERFDKELRLTAEAGIATNKLVSRVAAIEAAPERLLSVEWGGEEPYLAPKRPTLLPAADRTVRERLRELNVVSVGQIRQIELDVLIAGFGPPGYLLARQARGIDPDPVVSPLTSPCIIVADDLQEDTNDVTILEASLRLLVIEALIKLHRLGNGAGEMTFKASYSDGLVVLNSTRTRSPNADLAFWTQEAEALLRNSVTRRVRVKRLELRLTRLGATTPQQTLWNGSVDRSVGVRLNGEAVLTALEKVRIKFGNGVLNWGVPPKKKAA